MRERKCVKNRESSWKFYTATKQITASTSASWFCPVKIHLTPSNLQHVGTDRTWYIKISLASHMNWSVGSLLWFALLGGLLLNQWKLHLQFQRFAWTSKGLEIYANSLNDKHISRQTKCHNCIVIIINAVMRDYKFPSAIDVCQKYYVLCSTPSLFPE